MPYAPGGFVAFLVEVPDVKAHGSTPDEVEGNLRVPFAEYVAKAGAKAIYVARFECSGWNESPDDPRKVAQPIRRSF